MIKYYRHTDKHFESYKYFIDHYYSGKFIGHYIVDEPDRDIIGYLGRKNITLDSDIQFTNGMGKKSKVYKKGLNLTTECIPFCGKSYKY